MIHSIYRVIAEVGLNVQSLPNSGAVGDAPSTFLKVLLQIVFGVIGSVALLIIVISGLRYITAAGDPAAVAKARMTILYAVIGLAVALAGFSIVTLVVSRAV